MRLIENSNLNDYNYIKRTNGLIRLKERSLFCVEHFLKMRKKISQESHTRFCQEIEELRRRCREETDRARQARIDELSMHQERTPTVRQLLTQI